MNETMGMMMMGGEATPENLRKAKAIIEELLGETESENAGCGCCNKCGKANIRRVADKLSKEEEEERGERMGEWITEQINRLLELAEDESIETANAYADYDNGVLEILFEA